MKKVDICKHITSIGNCREATRAICENLKTRVKLKLNFTRPHAITYTHTNLYLYWTLFKHGRLIRIYIDYKTEIQYNYKIQY